MRKMQLVLVALLALGVARAAHGHGFSLSLAGNSLVATSNDFPGNGNQHLFVATLSAGLTSGHGGAGSTLFGTGKTLSFDVFGPLWFSSGNGNPAVPADPGITMTIDSASLTGSIVIDQNSTFTPGFAISGNTSHEFLWTLSSSTPAGVYGVAYRVKGSPTGGSPYEPTPLLVATFMTPNFTPGDIGDPDAPINLAQAAIFAAAVPEPSSVALAVVGAVAVVGCGWRRKRRSS